VIKGLLGTLIVADVLTSATSIFQSRQVKVATRSARAAREAVADWSNSLFCDLSARDWFTVSELCTGTNSVLQPGLYDLHSRVPFTPMRTIPSPTALKHSVAT
jgi:hypothetical protein